MYEVVGITLNGSNKVYYFDVNKLTLNKNQYVVVELESGLGYGQVVI